jgi:uncharacterized protein YidB (DUF937 family)
MALFGSHRGGMSPLMLALIGVLAYRTMQGKGRLAEMLGRQPDSPAPPSAKPQGSAAPGGFGAPGGLGGLLGSVLGGGALSGGLQDLLNQFRQNGQGDKAESWVSSGANKPVSPPELEQVLGEDRIQWLMQQTGLPRDQLLSGLSQELPGAVDKLTPNGRVPTETEAESLLTSA